MARHLAFIILLPILVYGQCPPPYVEVDGSCLFFETLGPVTHNEALQLCLSADGKLASVLTATRFKAIVDYINGNGLSRTDHWLDGSDEETNGTWLTSAGENVPMGTPFWTAFSDSQQPIGIDGYDCLSLNPDFNYYMTNTACYGEANAICETSSNLLSYKSANANKSIDCPTFYIDVGGKCLSFMTWADETWDSARGACIGLQGQLATIDDIELLRAVYLYLHQVGLSTNSFWLGGSDANEEGTWIWLDGSLVPMGTPFWGLSFGLTLEPDGGTMENCLSLLSEGYHYFRDSDCQNVIANPLCEYIGP